MGQQESHLSKLKDKVHEGRARGLLLSRGPSEEDGSQLILRTTDELKQVTSVRSSEVYVEPLRSIREDVAFKVESRCWRKPKVS
ncbi:hypothetical protein GDO81_018630 [Engystomops pustulosus]|uniref:Uncharacterized protein n=1 Tax=Engystomops pustulosus TaxID=76066 RepID=A0AAV6YBP0_ENGPU|nr:hypothetical protein GDO81_018630 [Engystomops pustulosus]